MYFSAPAVALALQRWPQVRRKVIWAAIAVMVASLIVASFCDSVAGLLVTQGVMYGLGGLALYIPCIQYIDEWFVKRKGMAFGIM